jgi:hypothetical protein
MAIPLDQSDSPAERQGCCVAAKINKQAKQIKRDRDLPT